MGKNKTSFNARLSFKWKGFRISYLFNFHNKIGAFIVRHTLRLYMKNLNYSFYLFTISLHLLFAHSLRKVVFYMLRQMIIAKFFHWLFLNYPFWLKCILKRASSKQNIFTNDLIDSKCHQKYFSMQKLSVQHFFADIFIDHYWWIYYLLKNIFYKISSNFRYNIF